MYGLIQRPKIKNFSGFSNMRDFTLVSENRATGWNFKIKA